MRHCRPDYDSIQPWPTKRPHIARMKSTGELIRVNRAREGDTTWYESLIPDDEPVFLLRSQDALAPQAVRVWADAVELNGGDPAMVASAREHADLMEEYAEAHYEGGKVPDVPSEGATES